MSDPVANLAPSDAEVNISGQSSLLLTVLEQAYIHRHNKNGERYHNSASTGDFANIVSVVPKEEGNVPDEKGIDAIIKQARSIAPELPADLLEANILAAMSATEAGISLSSFVASTKSEVTKPKSNMPGLQPHALPPGIRPPVAKSQKHVADMTPEEHAAHKARKARNQAAWRAAQKSSVPQAKAAGTRKNVAKSTKIVVAKSTL